MLSGCWLVAGEEGASKSTGLRLRDGALGHVANPVDDDFSALPSVVQNQRWDGPAVKDLPARKFDERTFHGVLFQERGGVSKPSNEIRTGFGGERKKPPKLLGEFATCGGEKANAHAENAFIEGPTVTSRDGAAVGVNHGVHRGEHVFGAFGLGLVEGGFEVGVFDVFPGGGGGFVGRRDHDFTLPPSVTPRPWPPELGCFTGIVAGETLVLVGSTAAVSSVAIRQRRNLRNDTATSRASSIVVSSVCLASIASGEGFGREFCHGEGASSGQQGMGATQGGNAIGQRFAGEHPSVLKTANGASVGESPSRVSAHVAALAEPATGMRNEDAARRARNGVGVRSSGAFRWERLEGCFDGRGRFHLQHERSVRLAIVRGQVSLRCCSRNTNRLRCVFL